MAHSTLLLVLAALFLQLLHGFPIEERSVPTAPTEDSFYQVPGGIDTIEPGTILKYRKPPAAIAAFGVAPLKLKDSFQILYRTTDNFGNSTATVLTVLIPYNADYKKLLSYQIAEDAGYANCAPSYALQHKSSTFGFFGTVATQAELLLMEAALEQGWVVITPDHEGPRGAFLANRMAGHTVLDGIRAALRSNGFTGIKQDATIALWGYSGGSIASGWAAELQPTYAPELNIAGAALGGPVPYVSSALNTLNKGPIGGLVPSGITGLSHEYPVLKALIAEQILPQYKEKFAKASQQCLVADIVDFPFVDFFSWVKDKDIFNTNPGKKIMEENSMGQATPKIPLFVYKSINDEAAPVSDADKLIQTYCSNGASVEYVRDLVSEHISLAITGGPRALSWLKRLMNGEQPRKGCTTKSVVSTLLDPSTIEVLPSFLIDALLDLLGKRTGPGGVFI